MLIYSKKQAQVEALLFDKAFTKVLAEYSNYNNIFLAKNIAEYLENTGINEHTIELKNGKPLPFDLIYSLRPVELKILKIYIKTNLANGFIRPFKFAIKIPIFFNRKLDRSFCFYVIYKGLNKIIIKNRDLLLLIGKLLDWLS